MASQAYVLRTATGAVSTVSGVGQGPRLWVAVPKQSAVAQALRAGEAVHVVGVDVHGRDGRSIASAPGEEDAAWRALEPRVAAAGLARSHVDVHGLDVEVPAASAPGTPRLHT